jgi:hypothetical protein
MCIVVHCSNLFEDLAGLLCKTAFPGGSSGSKGLGPMHLISLEALLALLGALAERWVGLCSSCSQLLRDIHHIVGLFFIMDATSLFAWDTDKH